MMTMNGTTRRFDIKKLISSFDQWMMMMLGFGLDAITLAAAKGHKLLLPEQVAQLCAQEHRNGEGLVAGLIARRSISILVGDSGLGKSPLAYQLGICVAAGIPFFGMETQPGPVVYADYENGVEESNALLEHLTRFLGLEKPPDNFLLWTPDHAEGAFDIDRICSDVKPALVIVDSLRAYDPAFEKTDHAGQGMKSLRSVGTYKNSVAIVAIHHTKKPGPDGVPPLDSEDTRLMYWLNQASGHRSLVNQSDTRIAADVSKRVPDAAMVLRWHRRLRSEVGPVYLQRVYDESGEAIGYRRIVGPQLLGSADQQAAFAQLPQQFTFRQAVTIYDRTDDPTRKWLLKCQSAGLVKQTGRGLYQRL
jgi:hypothetical protein